MSTQTQGLTIPTHSIVPSRTNPRKIFDKAALAELTESIRKQGVLQPLLVRPWPATRIPPRDLPEVAGSVFELVAGERRWRAAKAAELAEIPVVVRELSDAEVLEVQMVENLQRADLHPLEEAEGYQQLMTRGKYDAARIAEQTGRSVKYVYDRVKLLALTKEARKAFTAGKFAAGHAILLARLKPEDQARAMRHGALYETQRLLWNPTGDGPPEEALKPVSVRELQAWVDKRVRFESEDADPMLFPKTHAALSKAAETRAKVVSITHEHQVHPEARGEGRIYSNRSWKRADGQDGSKPCPRAVTGVVVAGPGRGEAFDVCVNRNHCTIHWGKEQRAKKKRTASGPTAGEREEERRREAREREKAADERWKKAIPAILEAVAEKVKKAPARAEGLLGQIVVGRLRPWNGAPAAAKLVPRGESAEDLVRHAAFMVLCTEARQWDAKSQFPKRAKAFGVDVKKILGEAAPKKKAARKAAPKKAAKRQTKKRAA